jgi:hypothetical protein
VGGTCGTHGGEDRHVCYFDGKIGKIETTLEELVTDEKNYREMGLSKIGWEAIV